MLIIYRPKPPNHIIALSPPLGDVCGLAARDFTPAACYTVGMKTDDAKQLEEAAAPRAALVFLEKLRGTYDVAQAIMFGSRARGDNRPDSDLDLAIVLNGRRGDFIDTKLDMAGIAFDVLLETGILVQAFPMWDGDLVHPERFTNPTLIQTIAADGVRLG
jgi:predicted nucleotidyltransferase